MAYRYTLADARLTSLSSISGACSASPEFVSLVNQAQRRLMNRGNWFGTTWLARVCIHGCRVAWPRYVGTVLGARQCSTGNATIQNNFFAFTAPFYGNGGFGNFGYGFGGNWGSMWGGYGTYSGWNMIVFSDDNMSPIFDEVSGQRGKFIRYHVVKREDLGKTCTLFGKQYGNQLLQQLVGGVWEQGLSIASSTQGLNTQTRVTKIDSVVREACEGMAYLYEWEPTDTAASSITVYGCGRDGTRPGITPPPSANGAYTWNGSNYGNGTYVIQQHTSGDYWFMWIGVPGNVLYRSATDDLYGVWNVETGEVPPAPTIIPTDPAYGYFRMLASYEPNETNPRYRRSIISNYSQLCGGEQVDKDGEGLGVCQKKLDVLVKLEFVPVVNDWDFLLIDNFDALKFMIQAIKLEEANDGTGAEVFILKATHEMNLEEKNKLPDQQTPVRVSVVGGCPIVSPI